MVPLTGLSRLTDLILFILLESHGRVIGDNADVLSYVVRGEVHVSALSNAATFTKQAYLTTPCICCAVVGIFPIQEKIFHELSKSPEHIVYSSR